MDLISGLEILLGEGGDVELGDRTSKHILLFAFDPLTLTLSLLFVPCIIHIAHSYIICLACLCVPHLCLTTSRALHREFGYTRWLH